MAKKSNISTNIAIGANLSGLTRGLKVASSKMRRFGSQAKSLGMNLSRSISAPLIGLGAISVKTFSGFEAEMSKVKAVSGATADQFKRLEAQAKNLGATTTFTATEVAGLQTEFAKLGFTASEIDKVTESTLYLAQAGGAELGRAAEVAGATLRAFGLEAAETGRVTDVMAKSFATSSLDMETFAEAMKTAAPIAKATGVSMEETSAMLGALANNGIKGSIAGTALKKILSELHQEGKPMRQTFRELASQNINLAEANDLVGERAKGALMILTEQMGIVDGLTTAYENANGSAKAMADEMMDNTAGAFKTLQSATEGVLIELGQAITENKIFKDILEGLTRTMGKITDAIRGMSDAELYNKVVLGGLLAMVPLVIAAVGSLTLAFGSLTAAMGPVGIAIAGVTALYLALRKEVDLTQEAVDKAVGSEDQQQGLEDLQDRFKLLSTAIRQQIKDIKKFKDSYGDDEAVKESKRYKALVEALESMRKKRNQVREGINKILEAQRANNQEQEKTKTKTEEVTEVTERQEEALVSLTPKMGELQLAVNALDFQPMVEETDEATKKLWRMLEAAQVLSESLNQVINTMVMDTAIGMAEIGGAILVGEASFKDFGNFALGQLANLFHQLGVLFLEYGIAVEALKVSLSMGPIGGPLAIGAGIALIAAAGAINAKMSAAAEGIPALAEGGIVTGPTLALIGEGRESEAVIPLSKLPQIAGATGGAVEVYGRLSGQDILLSTEKANRTRSRYRGF
jgi:TP901 family phage tail tape measure protein